MGIHLKGAWSMEERQGFADTGVVHCANAASGGALCKRTNHGAVVA